MTQDTKDYAEVIIAGLKSAGGKATLKELLDQPEVNEAYHLSSNLFERAMKILVLSNQVSSVSVGNVPPIYTLI